MRIDLLSSDCPGMAGCYGGGVATFLDHLTALLAPEGDELRIVVAGSEPRPIADEWKRTLTDRGVEIVFASPRPPSVTTYPDAWPLRICEEVTRIVSDTDLVYMQDWGGFGFHAIRTARFARGKRPFFVNVLHGASGWIRAGNGRLPECPEDLVLGYTERYAHRHCDLVASPTRYMIEHAQSIGWTRPPADRARVLGLPWGRPRRAAQRPVERGAPFAKLIFFGRQESRKGFEIFVETLSGLAREDPDTTGGIEEVVLLGRGSENRIGSTADALDLLGRAGLPARCVDDLDSAGALRFLEDHAHEALVVIPSRIDNHPYTVVEASMVPGLNMICSSAGGIPEILGERGARQLFDPDVRSCSAKLVEWLERGNLPDAERGQYDPEAANRRWLAFHREARELAARRGAGDAPRRTSIDLCVPCFNETSHLPQLLLSLERQSSPDFDVIVMDDGSTDPEALRLLERMRSRYESRGWRFLRQENAFVDAARNAAARAGQGDYLCFLDGDDVVAPDLVERLLDAIHRSGADCLMTCYTLFDGDEFPCDPAGGELTAVPLAHKRPVGVDLPLGLVDPDVLGSPVMIVRRSAFESVGGFTEIRGAGHEDYELLIKLELAGFDVDVLPEHLHFKREVETGLSKTMDMHAAKMRIVATYERELKKAGLGGLALTLFGAARQVQALRQELDDRPPADESKLGRTETGVRGLYHDLIPGSAQQRIRRLRLRTVAPRRLLQANLRWRWLGAIGGESSLDDRLIDLLRSHESLSFEDRGTALRSRVRHGPSLNGPVDARVTVLLLSYARTRNIDPIVSAALRCKFVERVVVSNNNPDVEIREWADGTDPRVELLDQTVRRGCGYRWRLAAKEPGEYFIAIDDDIFLYPEQLEALFRHLLERPEAPHGFFGSIGRSVNAVGQCVEWSREIEVDVLHQLYAVTRSQIEEYLRLLRLIAGRSPDTAELIESDSDDVLISRTGRTRPRIHDLGPVLRCPTADHEEVAVYKRDGFFERRFRVMTEIDRAIASSGGPQSRSSDGDVLIKPSSRS